jgi:hypothetical protein
VVAGAGVRLDGDRLIVDKMPTMDRTGLTKASLATVDSMAAVMVSNYTVTKWLVAIALPRAADAAKLSEAVKQRLIAQGVPTAYLNVLGAAGPARIGGVVQERGDDAVPLCPAGREVKQRPEAMSKTPAPAGPAVKPPEAKPPEAKPPEPEPDIDFE